MRGIAVSYLLSVKNSITNLKKCR